MGKFLLALVILFLITSTMAGPFTVVSPSMEDTLLTGDTFIAYKFWYGIRIPFTVTTIFQLHEPEPGDILIFANPVDPDQIYIKRCVAVGGQTLKIEEKRLYVDGIEISLPPSAKHDDPSILERGPTGSGKRDFHDEITLPDSTIFVMGDNRDFSIDSRIFGPLPKANIRGKVGPVFLSRDPDVSWKEPGRKIRLDRMFKAVR